MSINQKDMISSLSKLLDWLEQEKNWGTNSGELRFIVGRIGELYAAIMTNGMMALETNQKGYDVVSESGEHISVKSTTRYSGNHQFRFNKSTLNEVDRVILVYVNVEEVEIQIVYDAVIDDAMKLMVDTKDGKEKAISQSKIRRDLKKIARTPITIGEIIYDDYLIKKLESGTILIFENGSNISPVRPVLRKIARAIGVDINNGNGNDKNTRTLGNDVINQLSLNGVEG